MIARIVVAFLMLSPALTACKTGAGASSLRSEEMAGADPAMAGADEPVPNYFDEGVEFRVAQDTGDEDRDGDTTEQRVVAQTPMGEILASDEMPIQEGLALDRQTLNNGDVIFAWPRSTEVINRDYDRLGQLMREYSKLVGTMLHRDPKGPGEQAWGQWIRSDQQSKIQAKRPQGSKAMCNAVVDQLVKRLVPDGSEYRQYGNCGEGGQIGACLARRAGFHENEIRLCLSANDHFWAMVWRGGAQKWCILDRWDLIGNFQCGVDIDNVNHIVTLNGAPVNNQKWFKRAACTTMDKYIADPYASLYGIVQRL